MSRLIVKNLPLKITEEKLRTTLSRSGTITDLQLKHTKDGKFRGFAFVGFKTNDEAAAAQKYFHGTYIGASKIDVQASTDLGEASAHKPHKYDKDSKNSADKAKQEKKEKKKEMKSILDRYKDDAKFQEFLRAHQHTRAESWTNDSIVEVAQLYATQSKQQQHDPGKAEQDDDDADVDDDENANVVSTNASKKKDFFHVKLSNLPYKFKKRHVKAFLDPLKAPSIRVPPKIHGIAYAGFKTEKERNQALNKHKSLWEGQQIFVFKYDQKETVTENGKQQPVVNAKWKDQENSLVGEETVGESGRLFVRNLAYSVSEDEIRELFETYGPLTEVNLPVDRLTRRSKGFAFITFMMPEHAVKAFTDLDGSSFQGRLLHIIPGKAKDEGQGDGTDGTASYKKKKEQKEKAAAGSSHNWNALFLGGSAVADLMSEKYNVDKADVVLGDAGGGKSAAVKLALGETQIIKETKAYLEEEGVKLEAFNQPPKVRSKTVIIAKNLPANSQAGEMREMFERFGVLGRVVMPPGGVTAVIEFADPGEARAAFTNLAYTRFHNMPLYLEWGPGDAFSSPYSESSKPRAKVNDAPVVAQSKTDDTEESAEEPEPDSILFVKNLNFDTTDENLKRHFESCGKLFSASVATKKCPKSGDKLSMGFGFITYWAKASADRALKELQHSRLDTHSLELKRSNRAAEREKKNSQKEVKAGKPSTKLLVRNVAFQATKQEITEIFKTYGELVAVRLPSKMSGSGSHRGFAFIEYTAKADAKAAMAELSGSTHLYGRRLVLEWAEAEESIDELRKRTADQFNAGSLSAPKRTKFEIAEKAVTDE